MARGREQHIEHLLRRAAFGAVEEEVTHYAAMPFNAAVDRLLSFERVPDDVDAKIGAPGYVGVTARAAGGFQPATNIDDARQRWLFRMVHSQRPLQEKMALFWHNHFATAYSKIAGAFGAADAHAHVRRASRPKIRTASRASSSCSGSSRSATSAICWSRWRRIRRCWCGSTAASNVRARPQENFARELMELFTMGVGTFQETDVYARRARLHRLEPGAAGNERELLRVRLQRRPARHRREGVHVPDLSGTAAGRFRRAAPRRACRTASI